MRAGFDHAHLRDREGGLPMFEPERLATAGVTQGLVFVDTDHGFDIAFDPAASAARGSVQIARFRGDSIDLFTWEARGRPSAFRYRYRFPAADGELAAVSIEPLAFDRASPLRIEGESLWPARAQDRAWALPEDASGTCASSGRWLALHTQRGGEGSALLALPALWLRGKTIAPRVGLLPASRRPSAPDLDPAPRSRLGEIVLLIDGAEAHRWEIAPPPASSEAPAICETLSAALIPPAARAVELKLARPQSTPSNPSKFNENLFQNGPIFALDDVTIGGGEND